MKLFLFFLISIYVWANPLQDAIDKAKPFSIITLGKGVYKGNIVISKPLILKGEGKKSIIDGGKKGSVIVIKSKNVTIKNLTIRGSGHRKEIFDSAIKAENCDNLRVENCYILDSLYGLHISFGKNCHILNNHITSKNEKIPLRGDGLKMYYVHNSVIKNNIFDKTRDVNLQRSNHNLIQNNKFFANRFATYLELSNNNVVKNNLYKYNEASIMLMVTKNTKIISNKILSSKGVAAIGLLLGKDRNTTVMYNTFKYNQKALYIDNKPNQKSIQRDIEHNLFEFNLEALHFHAIISCNKIVYNIIDNNLEDVVRDISGYKTRDNIIEYNFWGRYEGFDKNGDGIGDTPYIKEVFLDKLIDSDPKIKFFFGSVVLALADFLCKIAPFSEPMILLEDKKPYKVKNYEILQKR